MVCRQNSKRLSRFGVWRRLALMGGLAAAVLLPATANAGGFFDFLFGGQQEQRLSSPRAESYAEPSAPVSPAPLGQESVRNGGGSTGHVVAYCVRLCDGQHFPLEHMSNATPVETCRAMCPASRTKVYFGSEIGAAVAKDGARYADLDNAYIYRKQLVANCTCNGKDALGLAPFDASSDPTLRPGDIVSTRQGLMAFTGRNGSTGLFAPVQLSGVSPPKAVASRAAPARHGEPDIEADDDPGTIAMPQAPPPPVNVGANGRAPLAR